VTKDAIFEELRRTMVEMFEIDASEVTLESHLIDDLGLDSIDAIDMAVRLQELTGKRVQEAELKSLRTVSDVVLLVERMAAPNN